MPMKGQQMKKEKLLGIFIEPDYVLLNQKNISENVQESQKKIQTRCQMLHCLKITYKYSLQNYSI